MHSDAIQKNTLSHVTVRQGYWLLYEVYPCVWERAMTLEADSLRLNSTFIDVCTWGSHLTLYIVFSSVRLGHDTPKRWFCGLNKIMYRNIYSAWHYKCCYFQSNTPPQLNVMHPSLFIETILFVVVVYNIFLDLCILGKLCGCQVSESWVICSCTHFKRTLFSSVVWSIFPVHQGCGLDSWSVHVQESISECKDEWKTNWCFSLSLYPSLSLK